MQGNVIVRLLALAVIAACVAYIVHLQGEITRLQGELAQVKTAGVGRPAAPAAAPQPAAARPAIRVADSSPRTLTPAQRQAMIDKLRPSDASTPPVWFTTIPNNPEAAEFQKQLQSVFEEAGWKVRGNTPIRFPMKAGVFIFSADEEPPSYVGKAQEALESGGVPIVSSGRGYRDFYKAKKAENPSWIGFEMSDDQTYVIVIGRKPEAESAEPTP